MLVTDAMPGIGADEPDFILQGKHIKVQDDVCTYMDGTLAGSNLDMATAFRNTVEITGLTPVETTQMSSKSAAAFLGLSGTHGTIAPGQQADWVWLDADFQPRGTWIGGVRQGDAMPSIAAAAE